EDIEHFDSYGYKPDEEFEFIPKKFRYKSHQDHKYLLSLLANSDEQINYSDYNFQDDLPIATCGRWVILRNMFNSLTSAQFAKMIYKTAKQLNTTPDNIVASVII